MASNTWDRVGDIFLRAIELPSEARPAFVADACGDDLTLRAEVEALLAGHGSNPSDAPEQLLPSSRPPAPALGPGVRLGAYVLEELVGRGGMGEVYRARRVDEQFEQRVAVKIVRAERSTPELVRRFLQERQIMARLDHPNIAALLDGGLAPGGQPYLVMPFVEGEPITRYAASRRLSLEQRLSLFVTICQAVQFAHRHLIVHRDLKPSNILVDTEGTPRLLDFGIAKLLDPAAATSTTGDLLLMTPEHAAPEQFLGAAVTTATDVHALGTLLYELLTGTRPFQDIPPTELARAVCEQAPVPPSRIQPVPDDLEQIVLMALRKEPARRYPSAGQFADDINRFLAGWPVVARPDTRRYRLRRFLTRHRTGVAAVATVIVTLATATGWSLRQSARRAAALEVAEAERARANRISNFVLGVFRATNPTETRGQTVTARELLDAARERVRRDLASEPKARADMELAIGQAYLFVGLTTAAESLLARAVETRRGAAAADPLDVATGEEWLARAQMTGGKLQDGLGLARQVVATRERHLGPDAVELAPVLQRIAAAMHERHNGPEDSDSALALLRRSLSILEGADSGRTMEAAEVYRRMAYISRAQGKMAEGLELQRKSIDIATAAARDPDDPKLFNFRETLAIMQAEDGQLDSSLATHRALLEARRRVYGPQDPLTSYSLFNIAVTLDEGGRPAEAIPFARECIVVRERAFGPGHHQTGYCYGPLATALAKMGDLSGSIGAFRRSIAILESALGPTNVIVVNTYSDLAQVLTAAGRKDEAVEALRTAVERGFTGLDSKAFAPLASDRRFLALKAKVASRER